MEGSEASDVFPMHLIYMQFVYAKAENPSQLLRVSFTPIESVQNETTTTTTTLPLSKQRFCYVLYQCPNEGKTH